MRIVFRCDASEEIGSGHIMRCRNLAKELSRIGVSISFLCRQESGNLIKVLERDFHVLQLPKYVSSKIDLSNPGEPERIWCKQMQHEDSRDCLTLLSSSGASDIDWIVIDHYQIASEWQTYFCKNIGNGRMPPKVMVIDDLANRIHNADILLDQNFFGSETNARYKDLVPCHCEQLLGPEYALLSREYEHLHQVVPFRTELRRILIFFGGSDSENLTGRVLTALQDKDFTDLAIDVVVGTQSRHKASISRQVRKRPNTNLYESLPSLAGLIARADLCIGAGGSTSWERSCLRLPSIIISTASNQLRVAEELHRAGHINYLGRDSAVTIAMIKSAVLDQKHQFFNQKSFAPLVDGLGTQRVVRLITDFQNLTNHYPTGYQEL